jgi:hypothetical protein
MHKANTVQLLITIKAWQPAYHQVTNMIRETNQLESNQNSIWLIYSEFPNHTNH